MYKQVLEIRTGYLIRDIVWLLDRQEYSEIEDSLFVLKYAKELQADMDKRWYHRLAWWR